jgi:hypothetical protein
MLLTCGFDENGEAIENLGDRNSKCIEGSCPNCGLNWQGEVRESYLQGEGEETSFKANMPSILLEEIKWERYGKEVSVGEEDHVEEDEAWGEKKKTKKIKLEKVTCSTLLTTWLMIFIPSIPFIDCFFVIRSPMLLNVSTMHEVGCLILILILLRIYPLSARLV